MYATALDLTSSSRSSYFSTRIHPYSLFLIAENIVIICTLKVVETSIEVHVHNVYHLVKWSSREIFFET
jgi:hypothetical protein